MEKASLTDVARYLVESIAPGASVQGVQPVLTTRGEVYSLLRDITPDPEYDEIMDRMIRAASDDVRDYTNRQFTSPSITETRRYYLRGLKMAYLEELIDPDTITSVVDANGNTPRYDIRTNRTQRNKGCYLHLKGPVQPWDVPEDHADYFITEFAEGRALDVGDYIDVRAQYGYNAIPAQISYQTARVARIYFSRESGFTDTQFVEETGRAPDALPSAVASALTGWVIPDRLVPV